MSSPVFKRIVYCSRASKLPNTFELQNLLSTSREFNAKHDISGILLYKDGSYLQFIEGEVDVINSLYERIKNNPRHYKVKLLLEGESAVRAFPGWHMGYYQPGMKTIKISDIAESDPLSDFDRKVFQEHPDDFELVFVNKLIRTFLKYA